jgi:hypothetical protein
LNKLSNGHQAHYSHPQRFISSSRAVCSQGHAEHEDCNWEEVVTR